MSVRATLVGILNKFGVEISPATEDKQDDIITSLNNIIAMNEKVKVSSNDTTADYLLSKLVAGSNIVITEKNDGSNEYIEIKSLAVSGSLTYKSTWDANTNTPTLVSGTGTKGDYYVVSVDGSTNLDGVTDWVVGDWAIYNGTAWEKADHTDKVSSVAGKTGAVTLVKADITDYDGIASVVEDTTPQLGGNLDPNGFTIGAIDDLSDAQNDTTNDNLFLGGAGFTGTFYNNQNTAIGLGALATKNTDNTLSYYGDNNVALGYYALNKNTIGVNNTAIGVSALRLNTVGNNNLALGSLALYKNTTGSNNTGIGINTLYTNTTGINNLALGANALRYNTTASNNTGLGAYALYKTTTGVRNTAQGSNALKNNTTGFENSTVGVNALLDNTTGNSNSSVGLYSLGANTTGLRNSALGSNAGRYIADGSTANATSSNSLYLGANTKALADGDANEIVIGYDAIGNGSNTVTLGNNSIVKTVLKGKVGIGTTNPAYKADINGALSLRAMTAPADPTVQSAVLYQDSTTSDLMVKLSDGTTTKTKVVTPFI